MSEWRWWALGIGAYIFLQLLANARDRQHNQIVALLTEIRDKLK